MKPANRKLIFRAAIDQRSVLASLSYKEYLSYLYQYAKENLSSYSYNKFAADLGFTESNILWLVISGRRKLTQKIGETVARSLGLNRQEKNYFLTLIRFNNATRPEKREEYFKQLVTIKGKTLGDEEKQRVLEYFSEWYHPIIREMSALDSFKADPEWISAKLFVKLRPMQIKKSLELLENLGYLQKNENGELKASDGEQVLPEQSSKNIAMARYHQKICEVTGESIASVPEKLRDLNTLTVSISDATAKEINKMIYEMCVKIMALEGQETNPERVYQFNLQSFALTQSESAETGKSKKKKGN